MALSVRRPQSLNDSWCTEVGIISMVGGPLPDKASDSAHYRTRISHLIASIGQLLRRESVTLCYVAGDSSMAVQEQYKRILISISHCRPHVENKTCNTTSQFYK